MSFFDEMGASGDCRAQYKPIESWLEATPAEALEFKRREAELIFRRTGITFAVYSENAGPERLIPFDIIPRVLDSGEWEFLSRGLCQRVKALNAFLADCYGERAFLRSGKIPEDLVLRNPAFVAEMVGNKVAANVYTHISGIDIVRVAPEEFYVLEDNCRTPS